MFLDEIAYPIEQSEPNVISAIITAVISALLLVVVAVIIYIVKRRK